MTLAVVAALAFQATLAAAPLDVPVESLDDLVDATAGLALESGWLAQEEERTPEERRRDRSSRSRESSSTSPSGSPQMGTAGSASTPQGRKLGVGLQLGYPTSLTLKYMLQADQGIVGGIGGFTGFVYDARALSLHVDWVYHPMVLASSDVFALTWYVGIGGNILVFDAPRNRTFIPGLTYNYYPTNLWLAARVPLGVNVAFQQQPFELYLEAIPSLLVFPGVSFGLGAAIGGRFYF